jgi:hypothetical protein
MLIVCADTKVSMDDWRIVGPLSYFKKIFPCDLKFPSPEYLASA